MGKKKRPRPHGDKTGGGDGRDRLGKLIKEYRVTLAGVLVVCGGIALLGLAALGYGWLKDPRSTGFMIFGAAVVLCALVLLAMNVFNIGRSLELRKRGLRFTESGDSIELLWDEITAIDVNRHDSTGIGPVTRHTRSSDAVSPTGPLGKTEWDITIHTSEGRSIRLSPMFMRMVSDPRELLSNLRLRSGLPM